MPYLKFNADFLFTGSEMLGNDSVLVTDEQGVVQETVKKQEAGDDIQEFKGMLSPGFVNCHCHLELSHMKGLIPEKAGLVDFVFKVVTERHFEEEEILEAIAKAEDEMCATGIVAVGDICNNALTLSQKLKARLAYYNFIEVSGWVPRIADQRFQRSKSYYDAFVQADSRWSISGSGWPGIPRPILRTSLVPHAPYSVSDELWYLMKPFFSNETISIHNQETSFEDELFIQNAGDFVRMYELMKIDHGFFKPPGKSSLQSYFEKLGAAKNVILVHNTFTKQEDVDYVKLQAGNAHQKVYWCLCINANLYIEDAVPPVSMLVKNDCAIVVGTDSLASNRTLNMLDEIKSVQKHFPDITTVQLLQWATLNGARALQMDGAIGSFEKGKRPGIILIDQIHNNRLSALSTSQRLL